MHRWLRRARRGFPFAVSGVVVTLFMAWGTPLMLAMRGLGSTAADALRLFSFPVQNSHSTVWYWPRLEVRRGSMSDWCVAEPVWDDERMHWPVGRLLPERPALVGAAIGATIEDRAAAEVRIERAPPIGAVLSPSESDRDRFARIDTGLAGWPFRAFASEAWYLRRVNGEGYEPMPLHRWNVYLGDLNGQQLLIPLRPLAVGFFADAAFWASASWIAVAFPLAVRRRRRLKYGRCGPCGYHIDPHAVKRPALCPECGAAFIPDPLGFARCPEMHFQNSYVWLVFVSSLDIMLTWKILSRGGLEVNPVAAIIIDMWGIHGAIAFKFALMTWVILICECLARLRMSAGRFLAYTAVIVSALPVVWSLGLLVAHELELF